MLPESKFLPTEPDDVFISGGDDMLTAGLILVVPAM